MVSLCSFFRAKGNKDYTPTLRIRRKVIAMANPLIENVLNSDANQLPFGLFDPKTEGKLTWICGYGFEKNDAGELIIVGVFCYDDPVQGKQREEKVYDDIEMAKAVRDGLLEEGWRIIKPPKIRFTTTDQHGHQRVMSRKEIKKMNRTLEKQQK